ncbi:MAG: hypothetical protein AAFQ63_15675 [Cyanobacteria bacterium J06621_11]
MKPIEPIDFVDLYLEGYEPQKGLHKKTYGWRGTAENYLANTLGISSTTVHKWGPEFENRPNWVPLALGSQHALRQIRKIIEESI